MKQFIYCTILSLLFVAQLPAQGIEFFHGTWAEAKAKALEEEKLIFIDAYASWCGPCKRMAAQTFPDPEVGNFFNTNFICVKYDMEKPENAEFAGEYPVRSYPTLMFIDGEGKMVKKAIGAKTPPQLIALGREVLGGKDNLPELEELYEEEGKRDPEFMYDYVQALNRAGKPSLRYTNEYLRTQKDLTTDFNLRFILEGTTEADSRVFGLLMKHKDAIVKLEGEAAVNRKIESACKATAKKAIEYQSEDLLAEAKQKMEANLPDQAAYFAFQADTRYYKATDNPKAYLKAAQAYQKAEVKDNPVMLDELVAIMLRNYPDDKNVLKQSEKWIKMAIDVDPLPEYKMTLASIYKQMGDKDEALKVALEAKKALGDDPRHMGPKIDSFIRTLDTQ